LLLNAPVFNHEPTRQASKRRLVGGCSDVSCYSLDHINGSHERGL